MDNEARLATRRERGAEYRAAHRDILREKQRSYFAANRESVRARAPANQARYKAAHPERVLASARAACARTRARHPEWVRAWQARYAAANPDTRRLLEEKRRARKKNAPGGGVSRAQWRDVVRGSLGLCSYCFKRKRLTLDHIVPLTRGGEHDVENVAAACIECNSSKHNASLLVWMALRAAGGIKRMAA